MEQRIIKFRAWNGEYMVYDHDYKHHRQQGAVLYHYDSNIMQFTGLTDKNGKEIYEGDILEKYGYPNAKVEYNRQYCQFIATYKIQDKDMFYLFTASFGDDNTYQNDYVEVIGNIYSNPTLT